MKEEIIVLFGVRLKVKEDQDCVCGDCYFADTRVCQCGSGQLCKTATGELTRKFIKV